jgi:hypothetical protein
MIGEKIALLNQLSDFLSPSSPTSFVHLDTSNPRNGIQLGRLAVQSRIKLSSTARPIRRWRSGRVGQCFIPKAMTSTRLGSYKRERQGSVRYYHTLRKRSC